MKHIILFFTILVFYTSSAQDPQIFENTWYLQNIIIDGQDNFPPSNDEVPFVDLHFFEDSSILLETNVCNNGSGIVEFDNPNSRFIFTDGLAVTLSDCNNPINTLFEVIYFDFFLRNLNSSFSYNITNNGNQSFNLIIISDNGDQAIYGNHILSSQDFHASQFTIYPNPAKNELFLNSKSSNPNLKIKIVNIEGKLLSAQNTMLENQTSIDVSQLVSGIYFLNIEDENGNTTIKKFIKQ